MTISAEVRWFWEGDVPPVLKAWFEGDAAPEAEAPRTDAYLRDPTENAGLKMRGEQGGAEVKLLVEKRGEVQVGPLRDHITIWTKTLVENLHLSRMRTIKVQKARRLKKLDRCNVELTSLKVGDEHLPWTTLGFEAYGTLGEVEELLRNAIGRLAKQPLPPLPGAKPHSYPSWLACFRHTERPEPASLQAILEQERLEKSGGVGIEWREIDRRDKDR